MTKKRIFISYKRRADPDEKLALAVYQELKLHNDIFDVFIDQTMLVGTQWAECIESELRRADYLITFLSASSVRSEMVQGEIEKAHHLSKEQEGSPTILPVRVAYREPFQYPLSAYLNPINWAVWDSPEDDKRLFNELICAISGKELTLNNDKAKSEILESANIASPPQPFPSAQPVSMEMPEGTIDPQSSFYITRLSDSIAQQTIQRQGVTITIKGPRQMGKSSLLIRTVEQAVMVGKQIAFLDFQLIDHSALLDADRFHRQFCAWITDELGLKDQVAEFWTPSLGNSQCCSRYMSRYLLKELGKPLVLAMDEVDRLFESPFRSDFFSMLRSWHNGRATQPIWKQLDLVLVTSTEPYQLIENLNQSPFNVGQVLELEDLKSSQLSELNRLHGAPLSTEEEEQLFGLVGGHPYLIRRALYLLATKRVENSAVLFRDADRDDGPFGDHLRYHLFRLYDKSELVQGFRQIIKDKTCKDDRIFFRLKGAGLVRKEGQIVLPRCRLYGEYFSGHLNV